MHKKQNKQGKIVSVVYFSSLHHHAIFHGIWLNHCEDVAI